MKLRFVDYRHEGTGEIETGTCDLCYSTIEADTEPRFVFWDDLGEFEVTAYMWSWGDYESIYVDDLIRFGVWVGQQDVDEERVRMLRREGGTDEGYFLLREIVAEYFESIEEEEEQ